MKEANEGLRRHKLMTEDIKKQIPKLYDTEETPKEDKTVYVKYFSPYSNWSWYVLEFDGVDMFFGLVKGFEVEYGYFSLSELANVTVFNGVPAVERDLSFAPQPLKEIETMLRAGVV